MAADSNFPKTLRSASLSFQFQQLLRLNPKLGVRAEHDRDRLAIDFLRAKGFSTDYSHPVYADAVLGGFDPNQPYIPYVGLAVAPPLPIEYHLTVTADPQTQSVPFQLPRPTVVGDPGTRFDFTPVTGTSIFVTLNATAVPGISATIRLHDVTDVAPDGTQRCQLYIGRLSEHVGVFEQSVAKYDLVTDGVITLSDTDMADYHGIVRLVVFHSGPTVFTMGTLSVTMPGSRP